MWWARLLNSIVAFLDSGVAAATNSYESIATTTVGSGGSASITFSSIPATYQHLQLRILGRSDRTVVNNDYLEVTFNGDTGANYSFHQLLGDGASASANSGTSQNNLLVSRIATTTGSASIFGGIVLDILDYDDTNKYKTTRSLGGADQNGSGLIYFNSGLWMNTAAITSITIKPSSAFNFVQYSQIALYGIKG
jgi:hypothetical protein